MTITRRGEKDHDHKQLNEPTGTPKLLHRKHFTRRKKKDTVFVVELQSNSQFSQLVRRNVSDPRPTFGQGV
jgi:hypothetical protein